MKKDLLNLAAFIPVALSLIAGWNYMASPVTQNPKPPHIEFKMISDLPKDDGVFRFELPSKQGYLIMVKSVDGNSITYIPRDVRWEGTEKK